MSLLSPRSRRAGPRRLTAVGVAAVPTAGAFALIPQSAAVAGAGIVAGGVYVPDNAAVREENSFAVNQVVNGGIVTLVNRTEFDALGYNTATIYVVPVGALNTVPWAPRSGTLLKERSRDEIWLIEDTDRFWIEDPAVLAALGYTWDDVRTVANGSLGGFTVGDSTGQDDLAGRVVDPSGASAAGYHGAGSDTISLRSADGKAVGIGRLDWCHGGFPSGYIHRGQYAGSPAVVAREPVGCIWAQVAWGYATGSVTFPPSASVSGTSEVGRFFVSCRTAGRSYPDPIQLGGLSYSKAMLTSSTLTVCTSATKADGPRNCSPQKYRYFRFV